MNRTMPNNLDAEYSVLGSILLDNEQFAAVDAFLNVDMFYKDANRKVYRAMLELRDADVPIDPVTLSSRLADKGELESVGGLVYLIGLSENVHTSVHSKYYGEIVREKHRFRTLINVSAKIMQQAYDESLPASELEDKSLAYLMDVLPENDAQIYRLGDHVQMVYERAIQRAQGIIPPGAIFTGYTALDDLLDYLEPGGVTCIGGATSMGKSTLAAQIAYHAALDGKVVLYVTLEMNASEFDTRILCNVAPMNSREFKRGIISPHDKKNIQSAYKKMRGAPFHILDADDLSVEELISIVTRFKALNGLDLLVIDYLHLLSSGKANGKGENRQEEIAHISRSIKRLTKRMKCHTINVVQFKQDVESRTNPRPMLRDIRDSNQPAQDASNVVMIYKPSYYFPDHEKQNMAEMIVAKQRNGAVGSVWLRWEARRAAFADIPVDQAVL